MSYANSANNQIHLTVKSVTPFAIAKAPPLFTSSDLGVSCPYREIVLKNKFCQIKALFLIPPPLIFAVLYVQIIEKEGGWLCLKAVFESFSGILVS